MLLPRLQRPSTPSRSLRARRRLLKCLVQHPCPGCWSCLQRPSTPRAQSERDGGRSTAFRRPSLWLLARQPSTPRAQSESGWRSLIAGEHAPRICCSQPYNRARLALAVSQSHVGETAVAQVGTSFICHTDSSPPYSSVLTSLLQLHTQSTQDRAARGRVGEYGRLSTGYAAPCTDGGVCTHTVCVFNNYTVR